MLSADARYCERVTADDGKLGEQHLRAFQEDERTLPTILSTSQTLSTGAGARNVWNIVMLRRTQSMIECKQIIGCGTRTFVGTGSFTIHHFLKAHAHFKNPARDGELEEVAEEPKSRGTADSPRRAYRGFVAAMRQCRKD